MNNLSTFVRLLATLVVSLLPIQQLFANDLDLTDVPLAVKTEGAAPNIMLLMDDSGSMGIKHGGNDVFYAPGYDSDNEYRCASGTLLEPVAGQDLVVYVSNRTDAVGTPYFTYNGSTYGWGASGDTNLGAGVSAPARCFDPDLTYSVKLKADTDTTQYSCNAGYTLYWSNQSQVWYCLKGWTSVLPYTIPGEYFYAAGAAKQYTGNFLNWYFSATVAELSDNSLSGGYVSYNGDVWTQTPAKNFVTSISPKALMGLKPDVHFTYERIEVAIDVAKMLIRKLTGINLALSSFHTQGDGTKDSDQNGYLMHGFSSLVELKDNPATSDDDANVSKSKEAVAANKLSLLETVEVLKADGDTPTSESMVRMARYFFQGWEGNSFDYFSAKDAAIPQVTPRKITAKTVSGVLTLDKDTTDAVNYSSDPVLTNGDWCQKSALAVLTDGQPTNDDEYAGTTKSGKKKVPGPLWSYDAAGTVEEDNSSYSGKTGIMRVPGALFDHDWIADIRGTQNIESFFIAFGDEDTVNAPIFSEAGKAGGGGGLGNTFAATDGSAVIDAFKKIIESVLAASTSVTAVAVSSVAKLQTENYAFQATYDTKFWTSDVKALNVDIEGLFVQPDGSGASRSSSGITPEWQASKVLNNLYILNDDNINSVNVAGNYRTNGVKDRQVFTWSGDDGIRFGSSAMTRPSTAGSSFTEFNILPQALKDDISALAGNDSQQRYDLMMYLLGDVTNEVNYPSSSATDKYRQRGSYADVDADGKIDAVLEGGLLGDIVDSSPVYIQKPARSWDDLHFGVADARHSDYAALHIDRPAIVYAGANDGMFHAFTVEDGIKDSRIYPKGSELFAYIPSMLANDESDQGLHYLANPQYEHRFYVDLTATASDVFMDFYSTGLGADKIAAEWRTIFVGGLRKGGKGYYALDVTCPYEDPDLHIPADGGPAVTNTCFDESFNAENILWEFDATDDEDMGYSFSEPVIAKVNYDSGYTYKVNGDERNGNGNGRWAAIVGNGYNSADGRAALYIVFLDGGLDGNWTEGVDYLKLFVSSASVDKVTSKNGLSSPTAIDINYDGIIDRVYAGDLKGQMWSFDISAQGTEAKYTAAKLPWVTNKLFTTGVNSSLPQSITTAPVVSRDATLGHVFPGNPPDLMVIFGTGRYLSQDDLPDMSLQSIYGVHDRGTYDLTRYDTITVKGVDYPKLEPRIFKEVTLNTLKNRTIHGDPLISAQFGWYVDLASDLDNSGAISSSEMLGERLAFRSFLAGDLFVFNTIIPMVGSCSGATQGWTMVLDWTTGIAYKDETYDANMNGVIDPVDQGYVGAFNEAAGSELGRGGSNIFDSVGDIARSQSFNFGGSSLSERIGWEEKMPFGIKGE